MSHLILQLPTLLGEGTNDRTSFVKFMKSLDTVENEEQDALIDCCRKRIEHHRQDIYAVKAVSDQFVAHRDPKYLSNPNLVWTDYPKLLEQLRDLVDCVVSVFNDLAGQYRDIGATPNFHYDIDGLLNRLASAERIADRVNHDAEIDLRLKTWLLFGIRI